jgi:hypothetical protein
MAAVDDPKTLGRTRLSFASEADIDEFVTTLEKFESGDLTPDQWRVFRLVRGTYGQRQPGDVQMLRVKIPQGVLNAAFSGSYGEHNVSGARRKPWVILIWLERGCTRFGCSPQHVPDSVDLGPDLPQTPGFLA